MFGVATAGMHPAPRPSRHSNSDDFDPVHVLCKCCDLCTCATARIWKWKIPSKITVTVASIFEAKIPPASTTDFIVLSWFLSLSRGSRFTRREWVWQVEKHLTPCTSVNLLGWSWLITSENERKHVKKYVNIPSEKYFYVHIYVCICVNTYLCKMDERRSYAACHKNGWVLVLCWLVKKNWRIPVLCQLVIKMDEYWSYARLS